MSKVLVTGSEGFIGSHLTEELVKAGHDVRAGAGDHEPYPICGDEPAAQCGVWRDPVCSVPRPPGVAGAGQHGRLLYQHGRGRLLQCL